MEPKKKSCPKKKQKTEKSLGLDKLAIPNRIQIDEEKTGLGSIPSTTLILAQCKAGKTYLLRQLLLSNQHWFGKFANIIVFSGTIKTDPSWRGIYQGNLQVFEEVSDDILNIIIKYQEGMILNPENWKYTCDILIILDDQAFDVRHSKLLEKLMVKYRHKCISIVVLSQYIRMNSPTMRYNYSQIISFGSESNEGLKILYDAVGGRFENFKVFTDLVRKATVEPHSFISFNNEKGHYTVWQSTNEQERNKTGQLFKQMDVHVKHE